MSVETSKGSPIFEAPVRSRKRLNYELMQAKIMKQMQIDKGEQTKKDKKVIYEAPSEHHRFQPHQVGLRSIVREINTSATPLGGEEYSVMSPFTPNMSF